MMAITATLSLYAQLPVAIAQLNTPNFNNMDSLANSGTSASSPLPAGWSFLENGTNANTTYGINDGGSNTGNSYSYGTTSSPDRAMGSLASGALQSTICAYYINQTGGVVSEVRIQFTMEQWRSGSRTTPDSSEFFWGKNNGGFLPANGTWNKNSALNLVSKIFSNPAPALGSRNGNDTANQIQYDVTIAGVNIQPGDTLYLRWRDIDAQGSDDGLAIDDFSITFIGIVTQPQPIQSVQFTANDSRSAIISLSRGIYVPATMSTLVFVKKDSAIQISTPTLSSNNYTANSNLLLATSSFEHDTAAKCVLNGDETTFLLTGLEINTTYHLLAYVVRDIDTVYSIARTGSGTTLGLPDSVRNVSATVISQTETGISWQQSANYLQSNHTTLVFAKANTPIQFAAPTLSADQYNASSNFAIATSRFEHDTAARCVYNGDGTQLFLSGLDTNTVYHLLVLTYRTSDSLYSDAVSTSFRTFDQSFVPSLISLTVSNIDSTQAQIAWTLPTAFNTSNNRVVVFAKPTQAINQVSPTQGVNSIIANATFGLGTPFEGDAQAFAVYNGTGTNLTITNLTANTTYHLLAFVLRTADSAYSTSIAFNFNTLAGPPLSVSNPIFTQGPSRTGILRWQKPADYNNATHTTLVFAKAGNTINTGAPLRASNQYTASAFFGAGSAYDFDTTARCVFRGDTSFVSIVNLPSSGDLSFVIHVIRDTDTATSAATTLQHTITLPLAVDIGLINSTNSTTGVPDSTGKTFTVKGCVIGFNQRLTGLQFLMRDATGGITILSSANTFGYVVNEGDTVTVTGTIISQRGLLTLQADTIIRTHQNLGTFNTTIPIVNRLNEATENRLIQIGVPVRFLNQPSGSRWPTVSANIRVVDAIAQTDTFTIRLLGVSPLAGKPLPASSIFIVSGIGTQNSSSTTPPFAFDGYQIIPRGELDIRPADSLSSFDLLTPSNNTVISLDSPFTEIINVSWQASVPSGGLSAPMYFFELDMMNGDFSSPITTVPADNGGMNTSLTIDESSILALLADMGLNTGDVFLGKWRVVAQSSYATRASSQVFNVTINMPVSVGLRKIKQAAAMTIFPNPANDVIHIKTEADVKYINICDMQGKMWIQQHTSICIDIKQLPGGIYTIQLKMKDGSTAYSRFIKQ